MTSKEALPPWLLAAVDNAGDATVILKPGNRPFVVRQNAPYHLGTQPLTTLMIQGLAQQLLSEDGHQALSGGDTVEETIGGAIPITVQAIRLDYDVVIRVRRAGRPGVPGQEPDEPEVDDITRALEEETHAIKARVADVAASGPTDISTSFPAESVSSNTFQSHTHTKQPSDVAGEIELPT